MPMNRGTQGSPADVAVEAPDRESNTAIRVWTEAKARSRFAGELRVILGDVE